MRAPAPCPATPPDCALLEFPFTDALPRCLATISVQVCSLPDSQIIVITSENDPDRQEALVAHMAQSYRLALHADAPKARG